MKPIYTPFSVKLSDSQKQEIETWLSTRLEEGIIAHAKRIEKITTWRKGYAGDQYKRDPQFEGGANVRIPVASIMIDAIHMRLVQSHFGVEPYVRVNPTQRAAGGPSSLDVDMARAFEEMLWHTHLLQNKLRVGYLVIRDALITGVGVSKTTWEQDYKMVRDRGSRRLVLRRNMVGHQYIPSEDFFIYPSNSLDVDTAQIVGHRYWRRWDELQRGARIGQYDERWIEDIRGRSQSMRQPSETDLRVGVIPTGSDWKDQPFELFELIMAYDLDGDGLDEDYLVVFDRNNRKLLRFIEYPAGYGERWYHTYTPLPNGDSIYGDSMYAQAVAFDEEITTIHNTRLDNNMAVNFPAYTVVENSPAAKDNMTIRPGELIRVSDHTDIRPLASIPPLRDTTNDEERLFHYLQLRLGVSELNLGQALRGEKTAYEIEAALAEGSIKIRLEVALGIQWLRRVAWHEIGLMKDFMPDDIFERVTGMPNPLSDMAWEDLWGNYDIEPSGNSTTSNRELERQKWVFIVESMKNDPLVMSVDQTTGMPTPGPGWYELRRRFLLAHGVDDYHSVIGPPPQAATPAQQATPTAPPPEVLEALAGLPPAGPPMATAAEMSSSPTQIEEIPVPSPQSVVPGEV